MTTIFISMFVFALIGAITPGPVNIIATGAGANFGFRGALPHVLGATVSYTLIVFLMGVGVSTALIIFPKIATTLQYFGGAFLLYMAYKIASATPFVATETEDASITSRPSFIKGVLAQGLNPKAWLVSMSGVSLFVSPHTPASLYLLVYCLISFVCCFIGVATWGAIGHLIGQFLSTPKRHVIFNVIMGLLLTATVATIFLNQ